MRDVIRQKLLTLHPFGNETTQAQTDCHELREREHKVASRTQGKFLPRARSYKSFFKQAGIELSLEDKRE